MDQGYNFTSAVRDNVLAGGDNCSRAAFLAACFAAQVGPPDPSAKHPCVQAEAFERGQAKGLAGGGQRHTPPRE
jgi:hypothetical protein